jgi:hypothetical protein
MLSRSDQQALLHSTTSDMLRVAIERLVYVDTVAVALDRQPSAANSRQLRRLNAGKVIIRPRRDRRYGVLLQQPNERSVQFLSALEPGHRVYRVDCALDFTTKTRQNAVDLQHAISSHLTMPWRGTRESHHVEGTYYFAKSWQRRNIAFYSDRTSKVIDAPACHMEFRWFGIDVCRSIGVNTLLDLQALDPLPHMERQSRLSKLDWHRFERCLDNAVRKMMRIRAARTGSRQSRAETTRIFRRYIARTLQTADQSGTFAELRNTVNAQEWLDAARDWEKLVGAIKRPIDVGDAVKKSIIQIPSSSLFVGARRAGSLWSS